MQRVRRFSFAILFAAVLLWLGAGQAFALSVKDLRVGLHPDKTRLVLELTEISKFRTFVLADPWRLVIDLPSFDWQVGNISSPTASAIKDVRQGSLKPGVSRIVVDLKQAVTIKNAFLLRAAEGLPDRLVIDFKPVSASAFAQEKGRVHGLLDVDGPIDTSPSAAAPPPPKPAPQRQANAAPPAPPLALPEKRPELQQTAAGAAAALPGRKPVPEQQTYDNNLRRKPVIILDAGHGGADPGAIGAGGILEKHITLAMAMDLKRQLEATGRYTVHLTRDRDIYLRLYKRVEYAHRQDGDLFISLHADSIKSGNVRGASIYTLSEKASDQQTAMLAERENRADLIAGVDLSNEDDQVASILVDLAMRDTMNQSGFFANTLVDRLKSGGITVLDSPHRQAGFAVLKAPDIPSVLIELGFMSNKAEAGRLAQPEYRAQLARALVSGIDAYFEKLRKSQRI